MHLCTNYHVHLRMPDGSLLKCGAQVIGGSLDKPAEREKLCRAFADRKTRALPTIEKVIPLDAQGNPTDAHPAHDLAHGYAPAPAPLPEAPPADLDKVIAAAAETLSETLE